MPHHRWSARGALRSGITRRWVRGNLLVTLLLLALIEGMFLYNTVRGYYDGVEQSMYQRFSSISGQLKTAFDRLFAVAECDPGYRNPPKESVLLMAAEGHGFEESLYWYDRLEQHIGWKSLGKVLCGGVMAVGDIQGRPELEEAYRLGRSVG